MASNDLTPAAEAAVSAVCRSAERLTPAMLAVFGVEEPKDLLRTLEKKDRYKIKAGLRRAAKKAQTLRGFIDGLSPIEMVYLTMHGRDSEVAYDICREHADRWRENTMREAFGKR